MKKKRALWVIAVITIIGFATASLSLTGCDNPIDGGGSGPVKTVSIGTQNGTLAAAHAGEVTFPVTTANIANGSYTVTVANRPAGITVSGQVTIDNNSGTLTLAGDTSTIEGTTSNLTLTIDGATSNTFTLTISEGGSGVIEPGLYAKAPPILASDTPVAGVAANDVDDAVTRVNDNPGTYTLLLDDDVSCTTQSLHGFGNGSAINLTIIGLESVTISLTGKGALFNPLDGATLTIGNNITLQGVSDNHDPVVSIDTDAEFIMLDGSKITGNTHANNAGAVFVYSGAVFTMQGGEISGNTGLADVQVYGTGSMSLSGSAWIESIYLEPDQSDSSITPFITIASGYTGASGKSTTLHLFGGGATVPDVIDAWEGKTILSGAGLSAAAVGKFAPVNFTTNTVPLNIQPIGGTHTIVSGGADIGKLAILGLGDRGPGGGIIFYYSAAGFTVTGIGTCHYLEAAPEDQGEYAWASSGFENENINDLGDALGSGYKNTLTLAEMNFPAARACYNYQGGGKIEEWFLPSRTELNWLYQNRNYVGNLANNGDYWSSSQANINEAYMRDFGNGTEYIRPKLWEFLVRPIRAF